MNKEVIVLTGAGSIGVAIIRRIGVGKTIVIADASLRQAQEVVHNLSNAGYVAYAHQVDISSRVSIQELIAYAKTLGDIKYYVNGAGVSPSQASIETILKVDLYGTAVLLEEFGKVISYGGAGLIISSQSGHRLPALQESENALLALTPSEELMGLDMLQRDKIRDTLHAYQLAKRANVLRVQKEALLWGEKGARINSISPGIILTPLANDELHGERGEFYRNMLKACPAKRAGTPDEVAGVADLLMGPHGSFLTGSDILMDGGATANFLYGKN